MGMGVKGESFRAEPTLLYSTLLYSTLLYYTILYYTILYYTILYYTILYYTTRELTDPRTKLKAPLLNLISSMPRAWAGSRSAGPLAGPGTSQVYTESAKA